MATIGTFKPTATGFEGTIATLMTNKKVRFVANEKKKTENSPDYFVKSGRCDLGVASVSYTHLTLPTIYSV